MKKQILLGGLFLASLVFANLANALSFSGFEYSQKSLVNIESDSKKWTILVFLSARCPCSDSSVQLINALVEESKNDSVLWLGVHSNQNEPLAESAEYFAQSHLKIPVLRDEKSEIANKYNALKTPHIYVIDNQTKKVLYSGGVANSTHASSATRNYLKEILLSLKEKGQVPYSYQRVLGCRISRS